MLSKTEGEEGFFLGGSFCMPFSYPGRRDEPSPPRRVEAAAAMASTMYYAVCCGGDGNCRCTVFTQPLISGRVCAVCGHDERFHSMQVSRPVYSKTGELIATGEGRGGRERGRGRGRDEDAGDTMSNDDIGPPVRCKRSGCGQSAFPDTGYCSRSCRESRSRKEKKDIIGKTHTTTTRRRSTTKTSMAKASGTKKTRIPTGATAGISAGNDGTLTVTLSGLPYDMHGGREGIDIEEEEEEEEETEEEGYSRRMDAHRRHHHNRHSRGSSSNKEQQQQPPRQLTLDGRRYIEVRKGVVPKKTMTTQKYAREARLDAEHEAQMLRRAADTAGARGDEATAEKLYLQAANVYRLMRHQDTTLAKNAQKDEAALGPSGRRGGKERGGGGGHRRHAPPQRHKEPDYERKSSSSSGRRTTRSLGTGGGSYGYDDDFYYYNKNNNNKNNNKNNYYYRLDSARSVASSTDTAISVVSNGVRTAVTTLADHLDASLGNGGDGREQTQQQNQGGGGGGGGGIGGGARGRQGQDQQRHPKESVATLRAIYDRVFGKNDTSATTTSKAESERNTVAAKAVRRIFYHFTDYNTHMSRAAFLDFLGAVGISGDPTAIFKRFDVHGNKTWLSADDFVEGMTALFG